jgi:hypothetical protein
MGQHGKQGSHRRLKRKSRIGKTSALRGGITDSPRQRDDFQPANLFPAGASKRINDEQAKLEEILGPLRFGANN